MTIPNKDHITWSIIGRVTIGALVAWAAYEFRSMREVVYQSQVSLAVIESELKSIKEDNTTTKDRVKRLEARIFEKDNR